MTDKNLFFDQKKEKEGNNKEITKENNSNN